MTIERLRELVDGMPSGVWEADGGRLIFTERIGPDEYGASEVQATTMPAGAAEYIAFRLNAFPALLLVAEAARATVDSPLHTPELEPTVVFDSLRAALAALDKQA